MWWTDMAKILIPAALSVALVVITWFLNENSKRQWERYKRKEDRYVALLKCVKGFYVDTDPTAAKSMKEEFINQLNLCWLYCPDATIQKGYKFLDHVRTGVKKTDQEKEMALGDFVLQLRMDLISDKPWFVPKRVTNFNESDFRILGST